MPWRDATVVDARKEFFLAYKKGEASFSSLCRFFGISRPTGYKWLARWEQGEGLNDRSRAPHSNPRGIPHAQQEALLSLRRRHPQWGPKKLLAVMEERHPSAAWPAPSSIGELLRRAGLTHPRRSGAAPCPARRRCITPRNPTTCGVRTSRAGFCAATGSGATR